MKTIERFYLAPEIQVLEISTEGIICESGGRESAGAGTLDDNTWGELTFGETNN